MASRRPATRGDPDRRAETRASRNRDTTSRAIIRGGPVTRAHSLSHMASEAVRENDRIAKRDVKPASRTSARHAVGRAVHHAEQQQDHDATKEAVAVLDKLSDIELVDFYVSKGVTAPRIEELLAQRTALRSAQQQQAAATASAAREVLAAVTVARASPGATAHEGKLRTPTSEPVLTAPWISRQVLATAKSDGAGGAGVEADVESWRTVARMTEARGPPPNAGQVPSLLSGDDAGNTSTKIVVDAGSG